MRPDMPRPSPTARAVWLAALLALTAAPALAGPPPWQNGANNDAKNRGLLFTVPQIDVLADFHGNPIGAKLVLYVGGNYFFAMAGLVHKFESTHPALAGHIYWETLPPGLLAMQLAGGGTVTCGNMTWSAPADAYLAGLARVQSLLRLGKLDGPATIYATNSLTIMVARGNPRHIASLHDLARPTLRLAMPNPRFEGVARQISAALIRAGGQALATAVYQTKVTDGTTLLTQIHHRQTPLWLMQGKVDAGVTWLSEAEFQEQIGNPIANITIPPAQNATGIYAGAVVHGAAHPNAARQWLAFLKSAPAQAIFAQYGFKPYQGAKP